MKKILTICTAAMFAAALTLSAQAQTVKTPEKPAVKTEAQVGQAQIAPKEATKAGEPATPLSETGAKEVKQTKAKTKNMGKKGKDKTPCPTPVEKTPETK